MTRMVRIIPVQPAIEPGALQNTSNAVLIEDAFELLEQAGEMGADLTGLPEVINVFGMSPAQARAAAEPAVVGPFLDRISEMAKRHRMVICAPVLERHEGLIRNRVRVYGRDGELVGWYDKTHLAGEGESGSDGLSVTPGSDYPVFDLDFGRLGVLTCMDVNYPEVPRILALKGAEILFFPAWQSGPSELVFDVQMRARAIDNYLVVVRSSYGYRPGVAWKPGMFFGRTSVTLPDGTIVADAGHGRGLAIAAVDLDRPLLMDISDDGGDIREIRPFTLALRRPETYGALVEPNPVPPGAYHHPSPVAYRQNRTPRQD